MAVLLAIPFGAASVSATTLGQKYEATKLMLAGSYDLCLLQARAKAVKKPGLDISGDVTKSNGHSVRAVRNQ